MCVGRWRLIHRACRPEKQIDQLRVAGLTVQPSQRPGTGRSLIGRVEKEKVHHIVCVIRTLQRLGGDVLLNITGLHIVHGAVCTHQRLGEFGAVPQIGVLLPIVEKFGRDAVWFYGIRQPFRGDAEVLLRLVYIGSVRCLVPMGSGIVGKNGYHQRPAMDVSGRAVGRDCLLRLLRGLRRLGLLRWFWGLRLGLHLRRRQLGCFPPGAGRHRRTQQHTQKQP